MTFVTFLIAVVVLVTIRALAPWLHTVEQNPLQDIVRTPGDAAAFAVVVVTAVFPKEADHRGMRGNPQIIANRCPLGVAGRFELFGVNAIGNVENSPHICATLRKIFGPFG